MAKPEIEGQLSIFSRSEVRPEGHSKEEAEARLNVIRQNFRDKRMAHVHQHNKERTTKHMIEQEPAPDAVQVRARMLGAHNYDNVPKRISGVFNDRRVK